MKKQKQTTSPGTLRRVLQYVGKYPVSLIGCIFFALLSVAGTLLVPVFFGDAIDAIVDRNVNWALLTNKFVQTAAAVL